MDGIDAMTYREAPPARIGRYEICGELGRGMMGVVFDAFDPSLGRPVALKVVHPTLATSPEEEERFERRFLTEARIAARLLHPGIVVVHDVGRDPLTGILFLAMERVSGRTVTEMVAGTEPPGWPEALGIVARVAEALHYAHEQGVVHRDIKPANIMVATDGSVKVMDFGLAKIIEGNSEASTAGWVGTPAFMSPEQVRGDRIDARADIFSLGAVAYTLITGHRPFVSDSVPRIMEKITSKDPVPPSHRTRGLPETVDAVLARAMARDVDGRYRTALEFGEDLDDLAQRQAPRHIRTLRHRVDEVREDRSTSASRPLVDLPLRGVFDDGNGSGRGTDGEDDLDLRPRSAQPSQPGSSHALLYLTLGMLLAGASAVTVALLSPSALERWVRRVPPLSRTTPLASRQASPPPGPVIHQGSLTVLTAGLPGDAALRLAIDGETTAEVLGVDQRPVTRLALDPGLHEIFAEVRMDGAVHAAKIRAAVDAGRETRVRLSLAGGQLRLKVYR